jgi:squalene-associated FAD-dependent desaturase
VTLTEHGIPCLILEQKSSPGGRAYSFRDQTTGEIIDNGQHVMIAGYERTIGLIRTIGAATLLSIQSSPLLRFHHPEQGFRRFSLPARAGRAGLAAGILRSDLLRVADRLRLIRAGTALQGEDPAGWSGITIREWLDRHGQSIEAGRCFWDPLAMSIMNEKPDRASAAPFLRALRTAFLGTSQRASLAFPNVGLSQLYAERAESFILRHGGSIRYRSDVARVSVGDSLASGVRLKDGTEIPGSAVILTVPPNRVPSIVPGRKEFEPLRSFSSSPIVSTHLWFRADIMPHDFVGLIGRTTQWIFNRRRLVPGLDTGGHVSTVISAAYDTVDLPNDRIVHITMRDLRSVYGESVPDPTHSMVIREKRATVSLTPSTEQLRPPQKTAIPNLLIAGDWTDTGYPATIESAVMSADRCSNLAIQFLRENPRKGV